LNEHEAEAFAKVLENPGYCSCGFLSFHTGDCALREAIEEVERERIEEEEERVRRSWARSNTLSNLVRADEARDELIRLEAEARIILGIPTSERARRDLVLAQQNEREYTHRATSWGPPAPNVLRQTVPRPLPV
jgi:hypothetical protein